MSGNRPQTRSWASSDRTLARRGVTANLRALCNHYRQAILKGEEIPGWSIDQFSEIKISMRFHNMAPDVYPDREGLVIRLTNGKPEVEAMRWGLAYWTAWRSIVMKWKSESRYPVPDEWKAFNARSSVLSGKKWKNWRAANPINAMLNYVYAVPLTEMRIKAIADGYDPMLGILHDQRHKEKDRTPSFELDLMEPMRPVVDRVVLKLISEETFSGG